VRIELSVEGGEPVEGLAELADWLAQEDELRGLIKPAPVVPVAGELGTAVEVLVAAVGSGGAVSVLAASLKAFLAQPRRSDVTIVLTSADGRRVEIDAKRVRDVEALVREVCGDVE
jgi:membrane-associated two-gene conflict system component 1 (EACC1)